MTRQARRTAVSLIVGAALWGSSSARLMGQTQTGGVITYQMDMSKVDTVRGLKAGFRGIVRYSVRSGSMRLDLFSDSTESPDRVVSQVYNARRKTSTMLMPGMKAYLQAGTVSGRAGQRQPAPDTAIASGSQSASSPFTATGA